MATIVRDAEDPGRRRRRTVERIAVRATLDDPHAELERARRAAEGGDGSWRQWLDEYEREEALIARLELCVELAGTRSDTVEIVNRGVWLERRADPPLVEAQVAEVVGKDFGALEDALCDRGFEVRQQALHAMYVHVELAEDLRVALSRGPTAEDRRLGSETPAWRVGGTPP